jgi:hypothetical protein
LRSASARCAHLWVLRPPEPVVYPPLPPPAVEDLWVWYHNTSGEDEEDGEGDDEDDEIEEESE